MSGGPGPRSPEISPAKSGISKFRKPPAGVPKRDVEIDAFLRNYATKATAFSKAMGYKIEPLSVYGIYLSFLTRLPSGEGLPKWRDLSEWLKVQVTVICLAELPLLTFTIKLHPNLERVWIKDGRDVRAAIRDRLRREFDKALGTGREFLFVIEGASKEDGSKVGLHIHGCVSIPNEGDTAKALKAAGRACGIGIRGAPTVYSGRNVKEYTVKGPAFVTYLYKAIRQYDDRLGERRLAISQSATWCGRNFWEWITGEDWKS